MSLSREDSIEHIDLGEPDTERLIDELNQSVLDASPYIEQYRADYQSRFCLWPGQTREGKKTDKALGGKDRARPWNNASDVRTFTADEIVCEHVEAMMTAWRRAKIQATPAGGSRGAQWSSKASGVLSYLFRDLMPQEIDRELELAAQWRQTYGISVLGIWWDQQRSLEFKTVTLDEMMAKAQGIAQQTGDSAALERLDQLLDPLEEAAMIEAISQANPVIDRQGARKFLRDLRAKGEGRMPNIYISRNQPCWEALRPFLDIFFPIETSNFASGCRWTARQRWMTETDIMGRIETEGWDRDWAEAIVAHHKGKAFLATESALGVGGLLTGTRGTREGTLEPDFRHHVQIFDHIYAGLDQKTGQRVLQRTIYSPHEPDSYGKHEILPYQHGQQPYIELVRERIERQMVESRSIPEIAITAQNTIKAQTDGLNDLAQISTLPTLVTPLWRSGSRLEMGPGAQIPERTAGELRFLNIPQTGFAAANLAESARLSLARYFGRPDPAVDPSRTQMAMGHLIGKFLGEVTAATKMSFQLWQQFGDDLTTERIVGGKGVSFKASREEIQGEFNLKLSLDAADLNFEQAMKKIEAVQKFVIPTDTLGVFNRADWTKLAMRMLFPDEADALVGTAETAAADETADEKKNLVSILCGVEPPMAPEGQNFALRLQVLQEGIQGNPILPQVIQSRPDVQAMLDARVQHLQFQAEQFGTNAQTGRVGAEPGLQTLNEQAQP